MRSRAMRAGLLVVVGILWGSTAQAQAHCTITWDQQLSSKWFDIDINDPGNADDDVYNWTPERYPTGTDHACFPAGSVANTDQVTTNTPTVGDFTISAGASLSVTDVQVIVAEDSLNAGTLNMSGNAAGNAAFPLTLNDGSLANGGEQLTNTGTINFVPFPTNSLQRIHGDLLNQGTINVNDPDASIQAAGAGSPDAALQTNQGTIAISSGNALRSIFSNFINSTGGVISGAGSMNMDQARFEAAANSQIQSPVDVNITNGVIAGPAGSTATGNIDVVGPFAGQGPSTLEGTVPAGITLDVDQATLRSPAVTTTVNAGRINLNGDGAQLQVLPNDTGTNSTSKLTNTGTIEYSSAAPAGFRFITGNLVNQGTILVNDPQARFQFPGGTNTPPTLTNQGTISVSTGSVLAAIIDAIVVNAGGTPTGGVINGAGTLNIGAQRLEIGENSHISSPLDFNISSGTALAFVGPATGATGNIDVTSGTTPLSGNVPSGITIDIDGSAPTLRSSTSFTNAGTINLIGNSALATEDGTAGTIETLTNTGSVTSSGSAGIAALSGDLVNQGQLTAGHSTTRFDSQLESRSPKLTNTATGTLTVPVGGLLASFPGEAQAVENAGAVQLNGAFNPVGTGYTQTAGTTTLGAPGGAINLSPGGAVGLQGGTLRGTGSITGGDLSNSGGTVAPGTSPGTLTLTDDYTQGSGGALAVEISGAAPGTGHDQLVVGGTAALAGTLSVATSGFTPSTGQQFKVVDAPTPPTAPTVTGSFATVQHTGGSTYSVAVNPTDVTLTALAPPPPTDGDGDGVPDASDNCPTQAGPASNAGCPAVSPPPDTAACDDAKAKLAKAKKKLRKLKQQDAPQSRIKKAKRKVKKAKQAVNAAC